MAQLSEEEAAQLKALQEKSEAPEPEANGGGVSRVINISVDLGDEAQVQRALKNGWLAPEDVEDDGDGDGDGDGEGEEGPKRRGFFPNDK